VKIGRANGSEHRFRIKRSPNGLRAGTFADEVRAGLAAAPKRLGPKWLYDELGSALFEAICKLPEYALTRVEAAILAEHADAIIGRFAAPHPEGLLELIELGSGNSMKTRHLLDAMFARQPTLRYQPLDISEEALIDASSSLVARYPGLEILAHAGDYHSVLAEQGLERAAERSERALVTFLGSNIGNYEPAEAQRLLLDIADVLTIGDGLLLGVDLKRAPSLLTPAYDDPTGVTAAFIKNILGRMNRELGADFDLHAFTHRVEYDEGLGAVNSYLEATRDQEVTIASLYRAFHFAKGERIHIESSYKFSLPDLAELGRASGFTLHETWTDPQQCFCEALFLRDN
jgi:L-histidine N-alpha-methyltransferase